MEDSLLKQWYARRPFGKKTLAQSVQLQIALRAREEGMSTEQFEQELARRNGTGYPYFCGNEAYCARPSRWIVEPQ